ncbi:signal peptidase I [Streptomyces tateyamensis]|uniref:Signal peptidase I n=1 Tax=Streptomyces tateyamensis TaxID=565073 RepID=A0A2V4NS20_9ACTN|nr:signal peptidase I [Streptomyces tateyamensis]PYC79153.1 signal peptidase I [Streptomyces tateyamensis]
MGDLVIGARGADEPEGSGGRTAQSTESAGPGDPGEDGHGRDHLADGAEPPAAGPEPLADDEGSRRPVERKQRSFWKELPILIGIALVLALVIKTFFVQAFSIPSESMQNTLQVGDRVLVDKLTPWFGAKPDRGEVVVFHDPGGWLGEVPSQESSNPVVRGIQDVLSFIGLMPSANEKDLIKRVVAVGGDTIECQGNGPLKVNGVALNEPYVFDSNPELGACGNKPFGPVKVPSGRLWVMGDHRDDSLDSRYHMDQPGGGSVPVDNVVGRAFVVAWPLNHWSTLPVPSTFGQKGLSAAGAVAPPALAVAGALPAAWWLRRRREQV